MIRAQGRVPHLVFLLFLCAGAGCTTPPEEGVSPETLRQRKATRISDYLQGYILPEHRAVPVIRAWTEAFVKGDTLWLEGIERRYRPVLVHLALAVGLGEEPETLRAWDKGLRNKLLERMEISFDPREKEALLAWKERFAAGRFEDAAETAQDAEPSTPTGRWALRQARAVAMARARRYMEAAELLDQGSAPSPVLGRRQALLRLECLRLAGRMDEAKAFWNVLADRVIKSGDTLLAGLLLDSGDAIENINTTPMDRGRIVSLGESTEKEGDLAHANRAYQKVWATPGLSLSPEALSMNDKVLLRAGLGILRIIAGGFGQGDASSRLRRWISTVEKGPDTRGRATCACELLRFKGAVAFRRNQLGEARAALTEALEWADKSGDVTLLAKAGDDLAVAEANCGEVEEALNRSSAALRAAEATGDPELLYRVQANRLLLLEGSGKPVTEAFRRDVMERGKRLGMLIPDPRARKE